MPFNRFGRRLLAFPLTRPLMISLAQKVGERQRLTLVEPVGKPCWDAGYIRSEWKQPTDRTEHEDGSVILRMRPNVVVLNAPSSGTYAAVQLADRQWFAIKRL